VYSKQIELDKFMKYIFSSLDDKNLFSDIYQQYLSKRLLTITKNQKCLVNLDDEKYAISAMKQFCGISYTVRIEGMINDFEMSNDILTKYSQDVSSICIDDLFNNDVINILQFFCMTVFIFFLLIYYACYYRVLSIISIGYLSRYLHSLLVIGQNLLALILNCLMK
jgi:hypothetical protein